MAYSFTFHHDLRLVYKRVWGSYSSEDSQRCHEIWDRINREGDVVNYDELQDLTAVSDYGVTALQIRALAAHYEAVWQEGRQRAKRMAYATPSALAFGTGRIYDALISDTGINFKVFANLADAAAFLELADADLQRVLAGTVAPAYQSPD